MCSTKTTKNVLKIFCITIVSDQVVNVDNLATNLGQIDNVGTQTQQYLLFQVSIPNTMNYATKLEGKYQNQQNEPKR
ncbi:unnamed protein product [Clavelina lepadiformis]|uniref:Uncharacterized protein n=1 Tax=Clavelina lepadiformis TaxID=159417 RepID=A0ABP0FLD6_CLALP